ncbi:hypothetical protein J437_LFUL018568 [Ladona fulva]|uniref:Gag-like protein n=1 Tax=Ladona fulva TaxID=123851 RepID=A0A8K0KR15_LADFU|nr:hypothetical protein J437_LFUL018568 [Ladona fulva]
MRPPSGAPLGPKHHENETTRRLRYHSVSSERDRIRLNAVNSKDISAFVMRELFDNTPNTASASPEDKKTAPDSKRPENIVIQSNEDHRTSTDSTTKTALEEEKDVNTVTYSTSAKPPRQRESSQDSWQLVGKKGKRRRLAPLSPPPSPSPVCSTIKNRFSAIAPQEDQLEQMDTQNNMQKKQRIPPILLASSKNWSEKFKIIRSVCEFPPLAQLSGQKVINSLLTAYKRKRTHIIRNLPEDITIDEIAESLEEYDVPAAKIVQLRTSRPTASQLKQGITSISPPRPLPLFQILLQSTSAPEVFESLPYVCNMKVKIERFRPPSGPPQCHRCQLFGHTIKACNMNFKCVKCGQNHPSSECRRPKETAAICANCKGDHSANYRGCPAYKALEERLAKLKEAAKLASEKSKPQAPHLSYNNPNRTRIDICLHRRVPFGDCQKKEISVLVIMALTLDWR